MKIFSRALIFIVLIGAFASCSKDVCPANNGGHIELMNPMKSQHPAIHTAFNSSKDGGHVVN